MKLANILTILFLAILTSEFTPCLCQFGMGEMIGEGMMGAFMAGGMGGGMGLGAGMGLGGGVIGSAIGGMARQQVMASAMDTINNAVHFIVGPQASPDNELLQYAISQRGLPTTMMQMMGYLPHLLRIAKTTYGPWLADLAKSLAAAGTPAATNTTSENSSAATGSNPPSAGGKTLADLESELDGVIMQRAIIYMDQNQSQGGAGGGTGGGANMASLGTMIPAMVQGIQAMYM